MARQLLTEDSESAKAIAAAEDILRKAGIHIWSPGQMFIEIHSRRFTCEDLDMGSVVSCFPRDEENQRFVLFN